MIRSRQYKLGKTTKELIHHRDSVASILPVNIHTPVLNAGVQQTVQPTLHMNALSIVCLRCISRQRSIHTELVARSDAVETNVLCPQHQRLRFGVNDGLFSSIRHHITHDRSDKGGNFLVDDVKSLRHKATFLIDPSAEDEGF